MLFLTSLQAPAPPIVIAGVTVIDAAGSAPSVRNVVVSGDAVSAILEPSRPLPANATVVRGEGKFLIPGLWDMHVHLAIRPEPELAERTMLPLFLANGVVGVRDMGGPLDRVLSLRARVRDGSLEGPRILTPGPFLDGSGDPDPAFVRVASAADAERAVSTLLAKGVDFLKVQAGLTPDAYHAIMKAAATRRATVVGHVPMSIDALDAVRSGQRSIEHISPALVGDALLLFACSKKESELLAELRAIEQDRLTAPATDIRTREVALRRALVDTFDPERAAATGRAIAGAGTAVVPTLVWSNSVRPLSAEDDGRDVPMEFVPAATRARWQQRRAEYLKAATSADYALNAAVANTAARAVGAMHAAGARVLAGTDTFDAFVLPGSSLHRELALLVAAGLTPLEALQAATRDAAAFRGTSDREGTIAIGKRADLVLLDADPLRDIANVARVSAVLRGGRVFARADLDALLARARQ
ncbi:MAG TPA: amidohydrolase family protein [Vicinamibacterales bacterium]